ncbi:hypothetical protein P152DRAFT_272648 [Eremomyces bilateralis CBS 781.70]|uniref:Secreted protein n=1 Tax=Eremomyces bilateralis CBS 781.70 TaxID=1392243 RepID=A0A6G1G8R9_9PEZI|nr:uncharacterized protein P152DRAFT_272648 [Eremomyces bilateralis CBS 781.70]KAF1814467.1 hypothetical protein P152DRAFT_272648 [Eremomyces bilateralis CBS 781.70]
MVTPCTFLVLLIDTSRMVSRESVTRMGWSRVDEEPSAGATHDGSPRCDPIADGCRVACLRQVLAVRCGWWCYGATTSTHRRLGQLHFPGLGWWRCVRNIRSLEMDDDGHAYSLVCTTLGPMMEAVSIPTDDQVIILRINSDTMERESGGVADHSEGFNTPCLPFGGPISEFSRCFPPPFILDGFNAFNAGFNASQSGFILTSIHPSWYLVNL